jgi:hypothetical protein
MKKTFIFLCISLAFSCRSLVYDNFPEFEPVPVLNCVLAADEAVKVHISLAGKIDSLDILNVENAIVLLSVNNQSMDTLEYSGEGFYQSSITAAQGNEYSCEVQIHGFPSLHGSDFIPHPSAISNIKHINIAGKNEEGINYSAVQFTFSNTEKENRYFEVVLKQINSNYISYPSLDPLTDKLFLSEGVPLAVFSNENIKGDDYRMTVNYTNYSSRPESYPLILELRSITYHYYRFVKDYYLYELGRYPYFGSSTSSHPLYSNINGGLGIFAGFSVTNSDTIFVIDN